MRLTRWTRAFSLLLVKRVLSIIGAVAAAAVGVVWYAVSPGVGTFQASGLLTAPLLILVLLWLHRRLPLWLQWALVLPLAPVGPVAYLVWGGDQWWNWGQLSPVPLVLLAMRHELRREFSDDEEDPPGQPAYSSFADGPWGPPGI